MKWALFRIGLSACLFPSCLMVSKAGEFWNKKKSNQNKFILGTMSTPLPPSLLRRLWFPLTSLANLVGITTKILLQFSLPTPMVKVLATNYLPL
jgi:hypothetical protein